MKRVLDELPDVPERVLDVGCGHGRFAALLEEQTPGVTYTGVDASHELLEIARSRPDLPAETRWQTADVVFEAERIPQGPFDLIAMFAVIHHVPGEARRTALMRALANRLAPGGTLCVAFWRLVGDDERRHVEWSSAGLDPADVEPGDRLQTFDGDTEVPRYAHFADEAEIERMSHALDLPMTLRFDSDGGDRISNAYLMWQRPAA